MKTIQPTQLSECLTKAITHILADTVDIQVVEVTVSEETQPVRTEGGVTVIVGITGDLEGSFALSMKDEVALEYTRRLLDMEVTEYDEVVASATGEFGNMVVAQSTMHLLELGLTCDLTPPTILRSTAVELRTPQTKMIAAIFETRHGNIEGRIFVREKPAS